MPLNGDSCYKAVTKSFYRKELAANRHLQLNRLSGEKNEYGVYSCNGCADITTY